jgi:heme exporter protein C
MNKVSIVCLASWFIMVILAVFLWTPLAAGLGEYTRILYFHVPVAWIAVLAFSISTVSSIIFLKKKQLKYDIYIEASNQIGFVFCILATITGSIWAKISWGSFWNWDPRETSMFILLLIYAAYFALRSTIVDQPEKRAVLSSVYSIFAFITIPFLVFIVPRIYSSLHPDPIINLRTKIDMDFKMLLTFIASLLGYTLLFLWLLKLKIHVENVKNEVQILWESIPTGKE